MDKTAIGACLEIIQHPLNRTRAKVVTNLLNLGALFGQMHMEWPAIGKLAGKIKAAREYRAQAMWRNAKNRIGWQIAKPVLNAIA